MMFHRAHKRPMLLLEVLIAFSLVVLCIFPLIAPHVYIVKAQYQFNQTVELDRAANRLYALLLEKIYRHEISWQMIEQKQVLPIETSLLQSSGLKAFNSFKATYALKILKTKGKKHPLNAHVISLTLRLIPNELANELANEFTNKQQDLTKPIGYVFDYQFFAFHITETVKDNHEDQASPHNTP